MKKTSFFIIVFIYSFSFASQIETNIIVENCKACHNLSMRVTEKIPYLGDLEKEEFVKLMKAYKNGKANSVMNRISKVLSNEDIKTIADIIYEKKQSK